MRHTLEPGPGVWIGTLAYDYPAGWQVPEHAHASAQLVYATRGVMEVSAEGSVWLIPPQFALWIPAGRLHAIRMTGGASMRTLYLRPELLPKRRCTVLHISPLLRELIIEAVRLGALKRRNKLHQALCALLVAEITKASPVPMMLAMPKDERARRLGALVLRDPRLPLTDLCRKIGVSTRTMQRLFRREVGIDFETWRRQLRLMKAIALLTEGKSIKAVTHAVGYSQASTFVAMFRSHLGTTPRAFMASLAQPLPTV